MLTESQCHGHFKKNPSTFLLTEGVELLTVWYRHSSFYTVNVGTHKKTRLLSSTKGEENRIEL